MSGRARGRGVARGRGGPPAAAQQEPPRRPGSGPQQVPSQPAAGGEPGNGHTNGAGRASHRGGARGEPRPGAGPVEAPTTEMERMSLGTKEAGKRDRKAISYTEPQTRPAHIVDKRGRDNSPKVPVISNYYKIIAGPQWSLYHYHVDFNPQIDSRKLRRGLLSEHKQMFGMYLFDGMALYTATKLQQDVTEFVSTRKYDDAKIRVIVKLVAELPPNSPTCLHVFNVLQRQILSDLGMKEVQRAYYSQAQAIRLPNHKLEIWPGFKTSILQYEESIMLNVDISHKVLRTDTVLDFMYMLYNETRNKGDFKDIVLRKLVGEIVLTRYNDKTYRIDDIEWDVNPTNTFNVGRRVLQQAGMEGGGDGRGDITYQQYYQVMYHIQVNDLKQPMLVSRPKKRDQRPGAPELLYLLPELCTMTGLTDEMRANFGVMKDLAVHTRVEPPKRAETMNKFMNSINTNQKVQERLNGWGIKFEKNLVSLEARCFGPEKIILGPDDRSNQCKQVDGGPDADWGRSIRGRMYTTVNLKNWALIYSDRNEPVVNQFKLSLFRVAPPMGVNVDEPRMIRLPSINTAAYLDAIRQSVGPDTQIVVPILPSNKKDLYDAIKKQCYVETPVACQCATFNVLKKEKGLMSVVTKIAIQINVKLGGEPWALQIPVPNNMVVGIDTYHDSAKKGRSCGGFVASLNKTFTRYYSQTTMHSSMQELSSGLQVCMSAALKKYHTVNNTLPSRIIVYRDGVGDGQLAVVVEFEVQQILEAIKSLGSNYNPEIVIVVVKKRINTRFFKGNNPNNLSNPGPGTVVDYEVTRKESYDFFLISQSVRQGTVTPTHYNVIWDTSTNLGPDRIQKLTYKLCHLYYNWPGTIRVPAPCQYAHKLAFLVGQSIHRQPDLALADKLYYL